MDFIRISPASQGKLQELIKRQWSGLLRPLTSEAQVIAELGDSGEIGLLPHLLDFAVHPGAALAAAARAAVEKLLRAVPKERLAVLDVWLRENLSKWEPINPPWTRLKPSDVRSFTGEANAAVLALATMHPNGRVREAALHLLASRDREEDLPFILLRLNDWVKQISDLSHHFVSGLIRPNRVSELLECLPIILQLERCSRGEHSWVKRRFNELLGKEECQSALQRGLQSPSRESRLTCLQFAIAADVPWLNAALDQAVRDRDALVRLFAAKQLLSAATSETLGPLCSRLVRDPFMPVRREALTVLQAREGNGELIRRALLDRHSSVREFARFYLRAELDIAGFYRGLLARSISAELPVAIRGLGESGVESDAEPLLPFLKNPEVRVRRAGVSAIGRLAALPHQAEMIAALSDPSPSVSAEARKSLEPFGRKLDLQEISQLLKHRTLHVRKNTLRLISFCGRWEQLPWLLVASRDDSEPISQQARMDLYRWLAKGTQIFISPTEEQAAHAAKELGRSEESLGRELVGGIRASLNSWKK